MADEVVNSAPVQSDEVVAPEVAAVPTDNEADVTTWKKRLAGKDQALTATKKELDEIRSKADELSRWKAQQEQASMSEFERAQAKIKELEQTIKQQSSKERRQRKERKAAPYPK